MADELTEPLDSESTDQLDSPVDGEDSDVLSPDIEDSDGDEGAADDASFMDTATLTQEQLDSPEYRHFQAAFTKRRQLDRKDAAQQAQALAVVERFFNDPAYARQVMMQMAPQVGLQFAQAPEAFTPSDAGQPASPAASTADGTVQELQAQLQEQLGDFGFLAPMLVPAVQQVAEAAAQQAVAPLKQRAQQSQQQTRQAEESRLLSEMDSKFPGWEAQHRGTMERIDTFLGSDRLHDAEFGSKYELIYRLATGGEGQAKVAAARQLAQAGRNRTSVGTSSRQNGALNFHDQIRKASRAATNPVAGTRAAFELLRQNPDELTRMIQQQQQQE